MARMRWPATGRPAGVGNSRIATSSAIAASRPQFAAIQLGSPAIVGLETETFSTIAMAPSGLHQAKRFWRWRRGAAFALRQLAAGAARRLLTWINPAPALRAQTDAIQFGERHGIETGGSARYLHDHYRRLAALARPARCTVRAQVVRRGSHTDSDRARHVHRRIDPHYGERSRGDTRSRTRLRPVHGQTDLQFQSGDRIRRARGFVLSEPRNASRARPQRPAGLTDDRPQPSNAGTTCVTAQRHVHMPQRLTDHSFTRCVSTA